MLFLTMPRFQSWSSPTIIPNYISIQWGHLLTQNIPDMWRLLHQFQRKSMAWRLMTTEPSRWMKTFIPSRRSYWKEFILGISLRFLGLPRREKKMGLWLKQDEKNRNWKEKNRNCKTLKAVVTNADTKLEEADDYNTVFSYLKFTVTAAPDRGQYYSASYI